MAYPISSALKALFEANSRQVVTIQAQTTGGTVSIDQTKIKQGGFSINRYCASSNSIEIGSVIAAELTLTLDNSSGAFDSVNFLGAELPPYLGTKDWSDPQSTLSSIPLGVFEVDSVRKQSTALIINALDRCVLFDKPVITGAITYPITVANMVSQICTLCNVTLNTTVSSLPNGTYTIAEAPIGDDLTYRQLISWCCEITGTCGFFDWQGQFRMAWYSTVSDESIEPSDRYSSTLEENDIEITGIQIVTDENIYLAGEEGYVISIEGNQLIQGNESTILSNLSSVIVGFEYRPYTATINPRPYYYPLDVIVFEDAEGNEHVVPITDITIAANKNTVIKARGESEVEKGYASANPLTKAQRVIIEKIQKEQNETLNKRVQDVLAFNDLICNSMGLWRTPVPQEDGSVKYYTHDLPVLEESNTIFTMTANGIAWTTTGWNGGSPVWSYGVSSAGDALFRFISAQGLNISEVGNDFHIEITPSTFSVYYKSMAVAEITASEEGDVLMNMPKVKVGNYIQCGRMRISTHGDLGVDFVFLE